MKKFLFATAALVFLLTGCSNATTGRALNLPEEISADILIEHNSSQSSARLTKRAGCISLCYSSPKYIDGLTLTKDENGSAAELAGLKISSVENYFSENSAISVLNKVLTTAQKSGTALSQTKSGDCLIFSGEYDGTKFQIKTNLQGTKIVEISVPDKNFIFTFN
mgnify:FL=1